MPTVTPTLPEAPAAPAPDRVPPMLLALDGQEAPFRAELYSRERLMEHARHLAASHVTAPEETRGQPLPRRTRENAKVLFAAFQAIAAATRRQEPITPAAEWMLDNFHVVEEQLGEIRRHLPSRYYTQLPKLKSGVLEGYPRVYALALELISHSDGALDEHSLRSYIDAYQEVSSLGIGELWAVAIMLRVGLVENLRRLAAPLESQRVARASADRWAERLFEASGEGAGAVAVSLGELASEQPKPSGPFVVRLLQRLRGRNPALSPVLDWLDRTLAERNAPPAEELVRLENQHQAADQVSISNTITSFRLLSTLDWEEFFESTSQVQAILCQDPTGVFGRSDFQTRDACRHRVEALARRCKITETRVAEVALQHARAAWDSRPNVVSHSGNGSQPPVSAALPLEAQIAYYFLDRGARTLERELGYRPPFGEQIYRAVIESPTPVYVGSVVLGTLLLLGGSIWYASRAGASPLMLLLVALVSLLPAADLAVSVLNRFLTGYLPPRVLPKLDLTAGIPPEARTLVVIPTLLTSEDGVDELLERLEVHYLANQDPNLHFAILTDFPDAQAEETPADHELLHRAVTGILELNERHEGPDRYHRFFLFHRPRRWNEQQGCWMGWERKRGKLMELNRLLRGDEETSYSLKIGDRVTMGEVKYVLSLDSDTQLPPDSARKLVATLAHPLNHPVIDPRVRRVVRGYGLLQPRVSISLTSVSTLFTRIFAGRVGLDPYTTAVSDVYQDLFGAGIFVGKGIYDIDAFEAVLEGRVGENELLSHDLFEGSFVRCALVTDIELFDDYPGRYNTFVARNHRWIRGDWQLLRWLAPMVRMPNGQVERNPLAPVSRWQMLDNMRRSLTPAGLVLLLAAGWLVLPGHPWVWTVLTMGVFLFPIYSHLATGLNIDPLAVPLPTHFRNLLDDAWLNCKQAVLTLATLPHQAHSGVDAVVRTLWRMFVSKRNLLEWTAAAVAERRMGFSLAGYWQMMTPAPVLAVGMLVLLALFRREALPIALPFLLLWGVAPSLLYWVSQPPPRREEPLSEAERALLRLTARKTWRFFEEYMTAETHWLPPDNVQEDRAEPVTERTSPTNIGLGLLSILSARDLGYLGLQETVNRLERTMFNLAAMERYCGHYFNWYETRRGTPIIPYYISTVDSGNLAGNLIALKQACLALPDQAVFPPNLLDGIRDTLAGLREALGEDAPTLRTELEAVEAQLPWLSASGLEFQSRADRIGAAVARLCAATEQRRPQDEEVRFWCHALTNFLAEVQRDLDIFLPWGPLLSVQPPPFGDGKSLLKEGRIDVEELGRRPHVFGNLVAPPRNRARGLLRLAEEMDRSLAEVERLDVGLDAAPISSAERQAAREWLEQLRQSFAACRDNRVAMRHRLAALADLSGRIVDEMDFSFLYDGERNLFSVGYDVTNGRLDHYHYDLLASECRLASFIAIAKRDAPQKHWFRMGRALTGVGSDRALVSWSGTMFEYLMPLLVMRAYPGTLLYETLPAVVRIQERYARREGVPWGISESGFMARDPAMNYQYRAFGVPGLGLKPDLFEDLVVSPYSTLLALPIAPKESVQNLAVLMKEGLANPRGFYEAADYTPSRLQRGQRSAIVRSLMAHHQGMSLVSIANYLLDNRMQDRFHADPLVKATELLLQERNPRESPDAHPQTQQVLASQRLELNAPGSSIRHYRGPQSATPRVQLLSNGRYSVMLTTAGGGYSLWKGTAITRWREDTTRDHWGSFCYLRDLTAKQTWSAAYQPVGGEPGEYDVYFSEDKVEFQRRIEDSVEETSRRSIGAIETPGGIVSRLEIAVSAEDDVEVRRLTLINTSTQVREIEVTSYAEVVLATPAADAAHVAFSNLFVETEFVAETNALLATRRPRSANQSRQWAFHVLAHEGVPAEIWSPMEYETDRARFIGRGRSTAEPVALESDSLSSSTGPVLDPIFSIRQRVKIEPRGTVQLAFTTGAATSRDEAVRLAERYHDLRAASRAFDVAWTHAQVELRHLGLSTEDAVLCQRLASRLLFSDSFVRPPAEVLARNTLGQSGLWAYGISGDLPIVLAQVDSFDHLGLVRQLLVAHEYLGLKGLRFDLVILNEHPPSYIQAFEHALQDAAREEGAVLDQPGGVFLRRAELVPDAGRTLLMSVARAIFAGNRGSLGDQLDWRPERREAPLEFTANRQPFPGNYLPVPKVETKFFNGRGGFTPDGEEYVVLLGDGDTTPSPWINVVANPNFGFIASEAGGGFTWSENSRENRLTPWSNDPVSDTTGEAIYLRNEETGRVWSPTPLPIRERNPYVTRHGAGYTTYQHVSHGLEQELTLFVPPDDSVKIYRLTLRNASDRPQRISATFYAEWVLGVMREQTHPYVVTSLDAETGALLARNSYNNEFAHRIAFADAGGAKFAWTSDRTEFLGRNGTPDDPRGLRRATLSGSSGTGMDPCAALQVPVLLEPGAERVLTFLLGEEENVGEAREVIRKYRNPAAVDAALREAREMWAGVLGAVRVKTPDPALDLLLNRWLPYQVLACRVWGRSAFYQSGGAYGFRDQLQDVMAMAATGSPLGAAAAREQILTASAHQFVEGDVQHWWHPPTGRGIRTRFSDDLLWLPLVTAYYLEATGDTAILDEQVPFLHGRLLAEGEDEYYDQPTIAAEHASVYEHCKRALRKGMTKGPHDLPLMGTGDWNDGMNLVGREGKGESVWVAWFLIDILRNFAPICERRGEPEEAQALLAAAEDYRVAVEAHAWDGEWYRRAYFDDGTPLGSAQNEECKIDAIAQSWSIISGAGDPARARQAMESVERLLVREEDGLILLFTPPFDEGGLDPGYIKGYVPGVRENGGQYTHAALWTVLATAMLGNGDRAHELYTLLNPIHHADTPEKREQYRVEPYVVAADVYGAPPHTGRGGWTWYTGSASWMYRIGLEALLGFRLHGDHFTVTPCIPAAWPGFELTVRHRTATYQVSVERGATGVTLDGLPLPDGRIPLRDDGKEHKVRILLS